jgi:hypothetical protein
LSIPLPSLYSSSLITQSDDPEDQTVLVFPDWKVCLEVENSPKGAAALYKGALDGNLGRAGSASVDPKGIERIQSWILPYRAVILLCTSPLFSKLSLQFPITQALLIQPGSHKRRDKRCHIAAPLLRSALHTVLDQYDISIDETGSSLSNLSGPPLEAMTGTPAERESEVGKRIAEIEGAKGGNGGEVGIFNINHLGGHRYAGVMLVSRTASQLARFAE